MLRQLTRPTLALPLLGATWLTIAGTSSFSIAQDKPAHSLSALDQLDRTKVPTEERFAWQPKELVAVLGSHRGRHWRGIESVAYSPDTKQIASAGNDSVVRLWDAETLREVAVLRGHKGIVSAAKYSKDGNTLASAGADGTIRLWDLTASPPTAKQTLSGHESIVYSLAFSANGNALASGDGRGTVLLWDLAKGEARLRAKLPAPVTSNENNAYKNQAVAFSPDGTLLATGNLFYVVLWDVKGKVPVKVRTLKPSDLDNNGDYFPDRVQSLAFSPDGKTLAVGHYDSGGTRIWDMTGDLRKEIAWLNTGTTRTITFSPNDKTLASAGGSRLLLWDMSEWPPKQRDRLRAHRYAVASVTFSPDGKSAVSGGEDGMVRLWDLTAKEGKARLPVRGHDDEIRLTALSPDGRTLATTSWDGTLRLWDLGGPQPKPRETFRAVSPFATAVTFTPDGKNLITANADASLRIWDVSSGTARLQKTLSQGKLDSNVQHDEIWGLAVSPDGKTAVTSGRFHGLRLLDLTTDGLGDPVTVKKPSRYHGALAYAPDGKTVVSGSSDSGTLRVWSIVDRKSVASQTEAHAGDAAIHAVAFAPDGKIIVSGGRDGIVRFWNVSEGMLKQQATLSHAKGSVSSVHFSPDGSKLVVAYGSGYIFLGDSAGRKLREWQLEGSTSARFAPDGQHLVMENANATVYILRLQL